MLFTRTTPLPQLGLWTFAFSPRFSFPLRPRSFFPTRQRFPISNPYQIHIWPIYGSRTTPDASIGLVPYQTHIKSIYGPYMGHPRSPTWTLDFCVFSAVFLPLEPTILFSHSSAVSHLKSRDFRLHEPTILFGSLVSGFSHRK